MTFCPTAPANNECQTNDDCCRTDPTKLVCKGPTYNEIDACIDHPANGETDQEACCDTANGFSFCPITGTCTSNDQCCDFANGEIWCNNECVSDPAAKCACAGNVFCLDNCVTDTSFCCPANRVYNKDPVTGAETCDRPECPVPLSHCDQDNDKDHEQCYQCCGDQVFCPFSEECQEPTETCCDPATTVSCDDNGDGLFTCQTVCCPAPLQYNGVTGTCYDPCTVDGNQRCGDGSCQKCCGSTEFCDVLGTCATGKDCCDATEGSVWCPKGDGSFDCETHENCCSLQSKDYNPTTDACCPAGTTFHLVVATSDGTSTPFSGCCDEKDAHSCCADPTYEYKEDGLCHPPCPCEGCCDYNCCDELDYFLHKAFEEMYVDQYSNFDSFYADWYADFYTWWYNGDLKH